MRYNEQTNIKKNTSDGKLERNRRYVPTETNLLEKIDK